MSSEARQEWQLRMIEFKSNGEFDLEDLEDLWEQMSDGDKERLKQRCDPLIDRFRKLKQGGEEEIHAAHRASALNQKAERLLQKEERLLREADSETDQRKRTELLGQCCRARYATRAALKKATKLINDLMERMKTDGKNSNLGDRAKSRRDRHSETS